MKLNISQKNGLLQLSIVLLVIFCCIILNQNLNLTKSSLKLDEQTSSLLENQECEYLDWLQKKNSKKYYVNTLNDYTASQIGLNVQQIDVLLKHLKRGNLIFTESEFIKVTNISEEQRSEILPNLRYPKFKNSNSKKTEKRNQPQRQQLNYSKTSNHTNKQFSKINLNTTTASELENQLRLPKFIAQRIINYRTHLNGYKHIDQIEKVYDILPYQVEKIKKRCVVE